MRAFLFIVKYFLLTDCQGEIMNQLPPSSKVYFTFILYCYDFFVHVISAKFAWKVNAHRFHEHYQNHLNPNNHLDIGVGTGLFIIPHAKKGSHIDIADINPNALNMVGRKLKKRHATVNSLSLNLYNMPTIDKKYQSIGLNYVLHCLSGNKKNILENVITLLDEKGTLFGSTIINDNSFSLLGTILMKVYNKQKIFDNINDTEENMRTIISSVIPNAQFKKEGKVLFFSGTV